MESGEAMHSIIFKCRCGQDLKARSNLGGRTARCPKCGAAVEVPLVLEKGPPGSESGRSLRPLDLAITAATLIAGLGLVLLAVRLATDGQPVQPPTTVAVTGGQVQRRQGKEAPSVPARPAEASASTQTVPSSRAVRPDHAPYVEGATVSMTAVPAPPEIPIPFDISPSDNIDERLFLVYALEWMWQSFPADAQTAEELTNAIGRLRHDVLRHYQYISDGGVDGTIAPLYKDYVDVLDAYTDFLVNAGAVRRETVRQAEKDAAEVGFNAVLAGSYVGGAVKDMGGDTGDAVLIGAGVAFLGGILDAAEKSGRRDEAAQRAWEAASRQVEAEISGAIGRAQNVALQLSDRYGWGRGEAPFSRDVGMNARIQQMLEEGHVAGAAQVAADVSRARPRDPFSRLNSSNAVRDGRLG